MATSGSASGRGREPGRRASGPHVGGARHGQGQPRDGSRHEGRRTRGGTSRGAAESGDRAGKGRRDGDASAGRGRGSRPAGEDRARGRGRAGQGAVGRVGRRPDDRRRAPGGPATDDPSTGGGRHARRDADLLPVPEHADVSLLDRGVRAELRSLSKPNAEAVGKHLVAAGELLDTDPAQALAHAKAARARAGRVGAVREAVGVAAYRAGEWTTALSELRAARRISGDPRDLPLIADSERALGRPDAAVRLLSDPDVTKLDAETRAELLIVGAGARRDLGQLDAALSVLARGGLDRERPRPGAMRLWYAYADALEAAGRRDEAAQWFAASAALDRDGELDAAERAADLL